MRIILDNREHALIESITTKLADKPMSIMLSTEVLPIGDICMKTDDNQNVVLFERKSLSDLLSSIKDGRYEEQSHRLINASGFNRHNIIYIIEGIYSQLRNEREKQTVLSAITSLNYFKGLSVMRTSSVHDTAELIIHMADKIQRDFAKGKVAYNKQSDKHVDNTVYDILPESTETIESSIIHVEESYANFVKKVKRDNITPDNIGEILLSQIPGVSPVTAHAILQKYDNSFTKFMSEIAADPANITANLGKITYTSKSGARKINKSSIENIKKYLLNI